MKSPNVGETIGIVRRLDDLGRIVIPMELRRTLNIKQSDALEIFATKDGILIRKMMGEN